jgi:uncharacterized protein (TIGR03435 family)
VAIILWLIGIASMGRIAAGQASQIQPGPAFEVASVKPNRSGPDSVQRAGLQPGDRVTMTNVTLRTLIQIAYPGLSEIVGGPSWVGSGPTGDRFDVNAKAEAPASREQLQLMLRTLLADRFKLAIHTESRDEPVFALVFARSDRRLGRNLRPAATDCVALRAAAASSGDRDPCGLRTFVNALVTGRMSVRGLGLDQILGLLSRDAGRKVVDKTGLSGAFDCELTWTPQVFLQRASIASASRRSTRMARRFSPPCRNNWASSSSRPGELSMSSSSITWSTPPRIEVHTPRMRSATRGSTSLVGVRGVRGAHPPGFHYGQVVG